MPVHELNIRSKFTWSPFTLWRFQNEVKTVKSSRNQLLVLGGVELSKPTLSRQQTKHLDRQLTLRKEFPNSCAADSIAREYVTLPTSSVTSATRDPDHALVLSQPSPNVPHRKHALNPPHSSASNWVRPVSPHNLRSNMAKSRGSNGRGGDGGGGGERGGGPGEWNRFNGFINKPARGWLYPDLQILEEGVCYEVRYVGCLEVNTSMKVLDFETRSLVAKECISRICEAGGLKTVDKKRKIDRKISRMLNQPNMEHAGADVRLVITSSRLELRLMENNSVIAVHEMPNISFASGGDADTLDFVAYVAKNAAGVRACYVLECGGKWAQDVITTIGQAFELRFKEYLKNTRYVDTDVAFKASKLLDSKSTKNGEESTISSIPSNGSYEVIDRDDPEYYNDLPGKIPPEISGVEKLPGLVKKPLIDKPLGAVGGTVNSQFSAKDFSPNLIDLNSEPSTPNAITKKHYPEYTNDAVFNSAANYGSDPFSPKDTSSRDPFDMQPFDTNLPSGHDISSFTPSWNIPKNPRLAEMHRELEKETWFHGSTSRKDSESLLLRDGEFLVRESQGTVGQYVLTGMQNGAKKHLLLVDPEGVVRTKDKTFDSVSHLVNYHRNNELPIISAENALLLKYPVPRRL